ncbi:MAG: uroporphyrinogen-III synthase [Pseudomonadales bacterium]|nr:uroporphyrinogen-III synthase [Pseudomonadales bacterium]
MSEAELRRPARALVTRPAQSAQELLALLEKNGWQPQALPMLEIDWLPAHSCMPALEQLFTRQTARCIAVFISVNAVHSTAALLQQQNLQWPAHVACAGIGHATLAALEAQAWPRLNLAAPCTAGPQDSEALLQQLLAYGIAGTQVLLFSGRGGRRKLQGALAGMGADVVRIETYRRLKPVYSEADIVRALDDFLDAGSPQMHAMLFASGETLANFCEYARATPRWAELSALPSIVPGERVAEIAARAGLKRVVVAANASANAFLRVLASLHRPSRCKL